ncbi:MAG: endonuclease/exonuclease/phosphatase family protein [Balneolaceae bacterium]|nr:endonuclease/exonuclease/phosphatase family protein [Balneolaceae bacterium]
MTRKRSTATSLLIASILILTGCSQGEKIVDPGGDAIAPNDPVPSDGRLEAVTWNIEWYGSESHGPTDELLQTTNVAEVMDSLKADLYALQEIRSRQALNSLLERLQGYRGFVADHINWIQKTAFIYNDRAIDSLSAGPITEGQDAFDWAGRLPTYFMFNYTFNNQTVPVYAVVIHAKANTGSTAEKQEAYQRRRRAADSLYRYLQQNRPDANIILLGDFNDDVDRSIVDGISTSPYEEFVTDTIHFDVITRSLSMMGRSSYLENSGTDLIDHIVISNELEDEYQPGSEAVYDRPLVYIENYPATTSDHLPVWSKFLLIDN